MNVVEKLVAAKAWTGGAPGIGAGPAFGLGNVKAGDQVLCRAAFRGMHEHTAGMCMSLYEEAFGKTPCTIPTRSRASRTTSCSSTRTVPDKVKGARLGPARKLAAEMVAAAEQAAPAQAGTRAAGGRLSPDRGRGTLAPETSWSSPTATRRPRG